MQEGSEFVLGRLLANVLRLQLLLLVLYNYDLFLRPKTVNCTDHDTKIHNLCFHFYCILCVSLLYYFLAVHMLNSCCSVCT